MRFKFSCVGMAVVAAISSMPLAAEQAPEDIERISVTGRSSMIIRPASPQARCVVISI